VCGRWPRCHARMVLGRKRPDARHRSGHDRESGRGQRGRAGCLDALPPRPKGCSDTARSAQRSKHGSRTSRAEGIGRLLHAGRRRVPDGPTAAIEWRYDNATPVVGPGSWQWRVSSRGAIGNLWRPQCPSLYLWRRPGSARGRDVLLCAHCGGHHTQSGRPGAVGTVAPIPAKPRNWGCASHRYVTDSRPANFALRVSRATPRWASTRSIRTLAPRFGIPGDS